MSMVGWRMASGSRSGDVELLDLEVAASEQEASQPQEARVATCNEDASARLIDLVFEHSRRSVGSCIGSAPRCPGHAIADLEPAPPALASGELDDFARTTT